MKIGQSLSSLAQRLLNTTGIWTAEENFHGQGSPRQSLILEDDVIVLSSPTRPRAVPGAASRLRPWAKETAALSPPSSKSGSPVSPRGSLSAPAALSLSFGSDSSDFDCEFGSSPVEEPPLGRFVSHSDDLAGERSPADGAPAADSATPATAAFVADKNTPSSPPTPRRAPMAPISLRLPPRLAGARLTPSPRLPHPSPLMPAVASAATVAECRAHAAALSQTYARLVCNIDAIVVMGARHEAGLSTESPERLGDIILATAERLGVIRAIDTIRATQLSLPTLRERAALVGSETLDAETNFCLSFTWGAAFGDDRAQRREATASKLRLAADLCDFLPGDTRALGAERRQRGIDFVARYVTMDILETLRRYHDSPEGRRYTAESRRAEPHVVELFRENGTRFAINHACQRAFDDWP